MSIIGIIASAKQTEKIKRQIENEIDQKAKNLEIIYINPKSIENMKNIKFDVIILHDTLEKLRAKKEYLREILKNVKYLLLNTDIIKEGQIFENINIKIITYGLNQKATITVSSIGETKIIICIQRAFRNLNNNIIEQQEIQMHLSKNGINDIYNSLIKTAIISICFAENR